MMTCVMIVFPALGSVADETLEPLVIANEVSDVEAGNARIQVLHGVPVDLTVDVYVTEVDADLSVCATSGNVSLSRLHTTISVPAGHRHQIPALTGSFFW